MKRFVTTEWFKIQAMVGLLLLSGQYLHAQDMQAAADSEVTEESIQQCSQLEDQKPNEAVALGLSLLNQLDRQLQPVQYGKVLGCLGWSYASLDQTENARIQAIQLEQLANQRSGTGQGLRGGGRGRRLELHQDGHAAPRHVQ